MRSVLFAALILLSVAAVVNAETLSGTVVDSDNHPIASATVLTNVENVGTETGDDGAFTLPITDQVKRVTFSSVGYHSRQFTVGDVPEKIVLTALYYPGEDIVVTADRAQSGITPIAFENYSRDEIKRDFTVGDLPLLLNTTPNYYSFSDGGGNLGYTYTQIRGFDDKRIAAYINGVPLNDPEDQYLYWVDLPDFVESVTDVQIQRGVGNSLYGDASFGGSMNVVTNTLEMPRQATLKAGYGEFLDGSKSLGKSYKQAIEYASGLVNGRWAFAGRFSKQKSDGYREDAWTDQWAYYLALARLDPKMTTELQVFGGPMRLRLTFLGIPRSTIAVDRRFNPLTYDNETDNFSQPHFHLHNTYRLSDRQTLYNTVYFIRGKGWFEQFVDSASYADHNIDPTQVGGATSGDLVRHQSVEKYQIGWNPRLEWKHSRGLHSFGGSFYYFKSDHYGEVTWAQHITGDLDTRHKYYEYFGEKLVASAFAKEYYNVTDRLGVQATGQLRYQTYNFDQTELGAFPGYNYDLNWVFFSPRIGFNYKLLPDESSRRANVYANFAVASRTPTDAAIYDASNPHVFPSLEVENVAITASGDSVITFGNPTFEAERVYDLEFGGNYRTPNYNIGVNFYWMNFSNEIISYGGINELGILETINVDGSYRAGVELSGAYRPIDNLTFSGNLSLNRYRIKDFTTSLAVYDASFNYIEDRQVTFKDKTGLGFPNVLANLIVDYRTGGARFTYRFQGVGKQYMEVANIDSLAIDAYTTSSITASYTFDNLMQLGDLTVTGEISNLFDKKFLRSGYGWNYAMGTAPGEAIDIVGGAEYYVAAERSFFVEAALRLF